MSEIAIQEAYRRCLQLERERDEDRVRADLLSEALRTSYSQANDRARERDAARAALERLDEALQVTWLLLREARRELDEARALVRELLPPLALEQPWSVRYREKLLNEHPWLKEIDDRSG